MRTYPIIYNKQLGGEFLSNIDKIFLENNIAQIDDVFNVVEYHGKLSGTTTSTDDNLISIPSNIFLIISDCCGAVNATNNSYPFYDGIYLEDSINLLTKSELLSKILNGKITIDNQSYHIIKPDSQICNLNLRMTFDGLTNGLHYKTFGENKQTDLINNTQKKFSSINKKVIIGKLKNINEDTNKEIFNGLINAFHNNPSLKCTFERTQLFHNFYIIITANKFKKDYYSVKDFIELISKIFNKLDVSSLYSTLIETIHLQKESPKFKIINSESDKTNKEGEIKYSLDFLIMILCYYFYIFDININKDKTTLFDILNKIEPTIEPDKFRFILLLSCQVSEGDFCLSRYCVGYTNSNKKLIAENEQIKINIIKLLKPYSIVNIDDFTTNFILTNKKLNLNTATNLKIILEQMKKLESYNKILHLSNCEVQVLINLIYDLTNGINIQAKSSDDIFKKYNFDDYALYELFVYNSNYKNVFFHIFSTIIDKCFDTKIFAIIENIKNFQKNKPSKFRKLMNFINVNKFDIYNLLSIKNYLSVTKSNIKQLLENKDLDEFNCQIDIYIYSSNDFITTNKLTDMVRLTPNIINQLIIYYIQLTYNLNSFQIQ